MFTGLVQGIGMVSAIDRDGEGARLRISSHLACQLHEGDSIAVNGVCLTATAIGGGELGADVIPETVRRSALGHADEGSWVNLELPLRASDRLGGHVVQGHVDGVGEIRAVARDGLARVLTIAAPRDVLRYVVEKGSIAVDGVSLTVASLADDAFAVALIPETLRRTSLGQAQPGQLVNLEVDLLAKYVEKLMNGLVQSKPPDRSERHDPG